MLWKILADSVMILHLLIMLFLFVSVVLLAAGVFKGHRNWRYFYCGVTAIALGKGLLALLRAIPCPLTELEYMLRRLYDPSESWRRTKSLLGTVIYNITGVTVPEYVFTIALGIGVVVMIILLILWKTPKTVQSSSHSPQM